MPKVVGHPQLPVPFAEGKGEMVADEMVFPFVLRSRAANSLISKISLSLKCK